jgi:uncharacterized protein with FMN-binding domain
MKRIIVGIFVAVVFAAYSVWVRHEQPTLTLQLPTTTKTTNTAIAASTTPSLKDSKTSTSTPTASVAAGLYKDGSYTGSITDAYYGNVQVSAIVSGGKLQRVIFLQYPNTHSDSVIINRQAMPYLQQEAIQAQSAQVDVVSGATFTSQAFQQSLQSALAQAQV